jgi:hypothetical protein
VLRRPSAAEDKDDQVNKDDRQNSSSGSRPGDGVLRRAAAVGAALAVTALPTAACGSGGSHAPGSSSDQDTTAQLDSFASCMRSHGVPGFYFTRQRGTPSPPPPGGALVARSFNGYSVEFDPASPAFKAAEKACLHLAPFFSRTPPRESRQQFLRALKSVDCLRSHGYPDWPDPPRSLGVTVPVGVDTSSPRFEAAVKKCGQP